MYNKQLTYYTRNMSKSYWINIILGVLLILFIGLTAGYSIGYTRAKKNSFPEIQTVPEINPGVATILLNKVQNGAIIGEARGTEARIAFNQTDILSLEKGTSFAIPLSKIDLPRAEQPKDIPADALYVASRNGKYYYPVFDKRALNIAEKNRLFFTSKEEAEKKGYLGI